MQNDRAVLLGKKALERRLVLNEGHDNLILFRGILTADQNQIVLFDAGPDHGIPDGFEKVVLSGADERLRQLNISINTLHRQDRRTAGNPAHHRHSGVSAGKGGGLFCPNAAHTAVIIQHALFLHIGDILGNRPLRQADAFRDLRHAGGKTGLIPVIIDKRDDGLHVFLLLDLHKTPPF